MRRHELELITGLAEGTLEDETEARALVASSPEIRAEFEAQRAAIEALRNAAGVEMTEDERASLRRDVWTELRARPAVSTSAPWYFRWSTAAAAVLVVLGGTAVISQSNRLDSQLDAETALTKADAGQELVGENEADDFFGTAADGAPGAADAPSAPADTSALADVAAQIRQGEALNAYRAVTEEALKTEEHLECLAHAGLEEHDVVGLYSTSTAVIYLIAAPEGIVAPTTPISFVDADTCELIHTDG